MLHLSQVDALITQSFEATGRPDLGFDFGRLIRVGSHDILGYALLSSPSLDYAVRVAVRFYRLMTPTFRLNRSEEHTSELQSLMRISYAVFCLKKKTTHHTHITILTTHRQRQQ